MSGEKDPEHPATVQGLGGAAAEVTQDAGPEAPRAVPLPAPHPVRIGPYEIQRQLGAGGMGVVYLARQPALDRTVALKVIRPAAGGNDPSRIERFLREARSAARLSHPNIVPIHDVGVDGDLHYFSMEYVQGLSLEDLAAQQPLSPRRALELVAQVARALAYAHAEGVIHRDIKPQNVMVAPDGRALLTDFGLAKDTSRESFLTQEGNALGTPAYMSPEQALGRQKEIDARTDVYSLGGVLYRLLAGRPPFVGDTPFDVVNRLLSEAAVPVRKAAPHVNADIETLCMKCLEKEPARRYAGAKEFAEDAERFLEGLPIRARPVSLPGRVWRAARRHRTATLGALAAVLAICVALVHAEWTRLGEAERTAAELASLGRAAHGFEQAVADLAAADQAPIADYATRLVAVHAALNQVLAGQPGLRAARLRRAEVAALADDFAAAGRDLREVVRADPDDPAALYALRRLGDAVRDASLDADHVELLAAADAAAKRLADLADPQWSPRSRLRDHLRGGRGAEAVREAEALLKLPAPPDPADLAWLDAAAHVLHQDLPPEEIVARADALVRSSPRRYETYRLRGRLFSDLGRPAEELREWETCVALQPRPLHGDLAELCALYFGIGSEGDRPETTRALARITQLYPEDPTGWRWAARDHRKAGRAAEAEAALERAVKLSAEPLAYAGSRFELKRDREGEAAADAWLDGLLKEHPPEVEVGRRGGAVVDDLVGGLMAAGRLPRAYAILEACVAARPDDSALVRLLAGTAFEMERHEDALRWFDRVLERNPGDATVYFKRGRVNRILKKYKEALRDLEKAVELRPANATYRLQYAVLCLMNVRFEDAAEQFAEALVLTPTDELDQRLQRWAAGDFGSDPPKSGAAAGQKKDPDKVLGSSGQFQVALPLVARALLRKGMKALEAGDQVRAERCFSAACMGLPKMPDPYVCLARLEARRRAWLPAIVCLEHAADLGYKNLARLAEDKYLKEVMTFARARALVEKEK